MYFSPRISYLKEAANLSLRKLPAQLTTLPKKEKNQTQETKENKKPKTQTQITPKIKTKRLKKLNFV